jgi:hypothetical protein
LLKKLLIELRNGAAQFLLNCRRKNVISITIIRMSLPYLFNLLWLLKKYERYKVSAQKCFVARKLQTLNREKVVAPLGDLLPPVTLVRTVFSTFFIKQT